MMLITVSLSEGDMPTRVGATAALLRPVLEHIAFRTKVYGIGSKYFE